MKTYVEFILNLAHSVGGVIDVTTVSENESDEGEIVSAAIWLPPKKRINTFNVYKLLTSGCIGLTSALGTQGVTVSIKSLFATTMTCLTRSLVAPGMGVP